MFKFGFGLNVGNGAVKLAIGAKNRNAKKGYKVIRKPRNGKKVKHITRKPRNGKKVKNKTRKPKNGRKKKYITKPIMTLLEKIFEENFNGSQKTALARYKTLNTRISSLRRNTTEYEIIRSYVRNGHGPTHAATIKLKLVHVFKINRYGEYRRYKPQKRYRLRRLLWHGTLAKNYPSILRTGLVLKPPTNVKTIGTMFGNGLYFADCVTKSFQYCSGFQMKNPLGILILAEVALGKHWYLTKKKNVRQVSYGKKSVKALGKYRPDKKKTVRSRSGAKVSLGRLKLKKKFQSQVDYNEYIVYNENQVYLKYLVVVKNH